MFGIDDILMGAIPSVVGGLFHAAGQDSANAQNQALNQSNNQFNSAEAAKNREWQEEMSNTSWQRGVKDMQSAGLNPMLSYMKGGASTPSGGQASSASPIPMGNVGGAAASGAASAASVANTLADTVNKKATTDLINAQVGSTTASAELSRSQIAQVDANVDKIREEIKNIPVEGNRLRYAINLLAEQAAFTAQQGETQVSQRNQIAATVSKLAAESKLLGFDIKAAADLGNAGRSMGQLKPFFDLVINAIRTLK